MLLAWMVNHLAGKNKPQGRENGNLNYVD